MSENLYEQSFGDELLDLVLEHELSPVQHGTEPTPGPEAQKRYYEDLEDIARCQGHAEIASRDLFFVPGRIGSPTEK